MKLFSLRFEKSQKLCEFNSNKMGNKIHFFLIFRKLVSYKNLFNFHHHVQKKTDSYKLIYHI